MFKIENYDYNLPEDLIAQAPAPGRDRSRLLVIRRSRETFSEHHFLDLPRLLEPGDLLVVNNTRVVPARLYGRKESGGRVEVLVLRPVASQGLENDTRWCLVKSAKRPRVGKRLILDGGGTGWIREVGEDGLVRIAFEGPASVDDLLEMQGTLPLPPYIKREKGDERTALDRERYQTVFSKNKGAVAAPTAGLHFTKTLLDALRAVGIDVVELTLHVGYGTFRPVRTGDIRNHDLGEEAYSLSRETANAVNTAKSEGRRVIAVGTTVVRTLETLADGAGRIEPGDGTTKLLITPGYRFKAVEGLITNFHLPRSSLLFLVSAFAGLSVIQRAYRMAVDKRYRFFSYGDAMAIL